MDLFPSVDQNSRAGTEVVSEPENTRENELARLVESGQTRELLSFLVSEGRDPFEKIEKKTRNSEGKTARKPRQSKFGNDNFLRKYWQNVDNFVRREYGGVYPVVLEKHLSNIAAWTNHGIDPIHATRSLFHAWTYAGEIFRAKLGLISYTPVFYRDRTDTLPFQFDPNFFRRPGIRTEKNTRKFLVRVARGWDKVISSQFADTFPSMLQLFSDAETNFVSVCRKDNDGNWEEYACMCRTSWLRLSGQKNVRNWRVVKKFPDRYDIVSTAIFTEREISASYKVETETRIVKADTDKHARLVKIEKHGPVVSQNAFVRLIRPFKKPANWKLWMRMPMTYVAKFAESPAQFSAHKKVWQKITGEIETETEVTRIYNETRKLENAPPVVWDVNHPGWD